MHAAVIAAAEQAAEETHNLPFDPIVFGLIAFGGLIALLLVTYAFRSVGTKH